MAKENTTNALKIDKQILDKFWTLSESDAPSTIKATNQLVELLHRKQIKNEDSTDELDYCVKRLVKGLASSRESARQGFSVALCQILRKFKVVTVEDLLNLVSKHLKLPKKESKAEAGYSFLGETLAYLALIQSGRLSQENGYVVRKVTKCLLSISKKRSYLQQICCHAVCLIIKQSSSEDFQQYVWPEVGSVLHCGWDECTPDILCMLITCKKHHSDLVNKQFLKEHWGTKKLFKEDNFSKLWKVIVAANSCYPVIHNINKKIIEELMNNNCSLGNFWQSGQGLVFSTSNMRILNIGFHMLMELLPLVKAADEIKQILTSETIRTWVKNIDGNLRDVNPLLAVTKTVGSEFIKVIKSCNSPEIQTTILKCLITTDIKPKNETNKTLDLIIQQLSPEAAKNYGNHLMESVLKLASAEDSERSGMVSAPEMVIQLRTLVTLSSTATDHPWQLELLQFLVLHSYWNVIEESRDLPHCDKKCEDMNEKLRKQFQDNFHRSITQLLIFKTESSKSSSVHAYKDTMYHLLMYVQNLLSDKTTVHLIRPLSDQSTEDWKTVLKHMEEVHSKEETSGSSLNHAFELLFLYHGIQLLTEEGKDNSSLQDLIVCHQKATETRRKSTTKKTEEEPEWIEVLTELLLSMMSHGSTYSRVVARNVFACLTNHITPASMSLITEVLRVEKPGEDDALIDIEDDEDMEDIGSDDDINKDQDVEMENNESESDEDTESSESEDEDVNEDFRTAIKSALGPAAVEQAEDDDKEEEDDDLSDSEMFRLDDALSQVFKNLKKTKDKKKKETEKQLNIFKLRVLDMVEALIKTHPSADLVLDMLFPLLELMEHGQKQKENRELSNRATHIFKLLYKKAKVHSNTTVGTEKYLESVKSVIEFSKKALDRSLLLNVSDACFLVIRLLLHLEINDLEPSPIRTRSKKSQDNALSKSEKEQERLHKEVVGILDASLQTYLEKRESKLNPVFFVNIFTKAPVICWPLTKTLLNILKEKDSKVYFKTQACSMLAVMINKATHENLESDEWETFSTELLQAVENIIREASQEEIKNKLMTNIFLVLNKLMPLSDHVKVSEDVVQLLNAQRQRFNTDSRRLYNSVMKLQTRNSNPVQKRKADTDIQRTASIKKKKKTTK